MQDFLYNIVKLAVNKVKLGRKQTNEDMAIMETKNHKNKQDNDFNTKEFISV